MTSLMARSNYTMVGKPTLSNRYKAIYCVSTRWVSPLDIVSRLLIQHEGIGRTQENHLSKVVPFLRSRLN